MADRDDGKHTDWLLGARLSRRRVLGGLAGGGAAMLTATVPAARAGAQAAPPQVGAGHVAANPHNVLSAVVAADGLAGTTVRVEYGSDGKFGERTPEFPLASASGGLPVLGLRAETDYTLRVVATGDGGKTAVGQPLTFRTGALPATVPAFDVRSPGKPEPGFTLLAPVAPQSGWYLPSTVVIVDATGRVVWYRETPTMVLDFQLQPNGHFTAALSQPDPKGTVGAAIYQEWDLLGNVVATWTAQNHPLTDWHEIRLINNGQDALLFGYVEKQVDTRPFGGPANGVVVGHVLQRLNRAGAVLFEWNAFDHYKITDSLDFVWTDPQHPPGRYDWTHPNAIELDHDGNYLTSCRHFSEVTKIDAKTGEVIWRMGMCKANEFKFIDDPLNGFSMQHAIRRLPNGHIILFDNGNDHKPSQSRAVEYEVDEQAKTARLVWSFAPGIFGGAMGYADRLPGGNTLVAFGHDYRVIEVSPAGEVVWELSYPIRGWGSPAYRQASPGQGVGAFGFYRAYRLPALYGTPQ